ncbi:MAG: hypothetical protein JWQ76_5772 [Ramlibacter sp.]|jgi:hypothetical protein|nr:hypothetical protein [Ramlibacter sp.]
MRRSSHEDATGNCQQCDRRGSIKAALTLPAVDPDTAILEIEIQFEDAAAAQRRSVDELAIPQLV